MAKLTVYADREKDTIQKEVYGHFIEHLGRCVYGGLYVGEDSEIPNIKGIRKDVIEALKEIKVPVIRWPGGCFSENYHWRDGIGPKEERVPMNNVGWGYDMDSNHFGTHEYMELCKQVGCKTYIGINVGTGTPQEMKDWIEYMTYDGDSPLANLRRENGQEEPFPLDYIGIGNENWECGGSMRPVQYADEYRKFQTYIRDFQKDRKIQKVACGPGGPDYTWTREVLKACNEQCTRDDVVYRAWNYMDGFSLHHYTIGTEDWFHKGSVTAFDENEYYFSIQRAYQMEEMIVKHSAIMDEYDPQKKIGLLVDEWGTWFDPQTEYLPSLFFQWGTMRDAVIAAMTLNIFNKHADRVRMANLAQMVNILQSVVLTEGAHMLKTPTFYVFKMYRDHQDATLLESELICNNLSECKQEVPHISESVSLDKDGKIHITLTNLSMTEGETLEISFEGRDIKKVCGEIMEGDAHTYNSFLEPDNLVSKEMAPLSCKDGKLTLEVPPCSVIHLMAE